MRMNRFLVLVAGFLICLSMGIVYANDQDSLNWKKGNSLGSKWHWENGAGSGLER